MCNVTYLEVVKLTLYVSSQDLSVFVVQVLNGAGDLLDLIHVVDPEGRPKFDKMSHAQVKQYILENSHCSALIKVRY